MNCAEYQKERRKQRRVEQFPAEAHCIFDDESDPRCLERHHVAGKTFSNTQVIVCRNHHPKLSDMQMDHPAVLTDSPTIAECEGRKFLGIADIMELLNSPPELVKLVREAGLYLIACGQGETL